MRAFKRILIFAFMIALLMLKVNYLIAQEKFSIPTGKVVEIQEGFGCMWIE